MSSLFFYIFPLVQIAQKRVKIISQTVQSGKLNIENKFQND